MSKSGKKTVALIGYAPMGNTHSEQMQPNYVQQPTYIQPPVYAPAPPQYYAPQPAYQQPAPAFNPNLVAIAGVGILVFGVYMYFSDPLSSLLSMFKKNPEKDQDTPYAIAAMRLYGAMGKFSNNNEDELYTVAQEIHDAMQSNPKFYANTKDWFSRKYQVTLDKRLTDTGVTGNELKKFYSIIQNGGYSAAANNAIKNDQSVFQQAANTVGMGNKIELKELPCAYKANEKIIAKGKWNVRTSPQVNNGGYASMAVTVTAWSAGFGPFAKWIGNKLGTNPNIAFQFNSNTPQCIGIATGKMFESDQDGKKTKWIEFAHKGYDYSGSERIIKGMKKIATNYAFDAQNLTKGYLLYISANALLPAGTIAAGTSLSNYSSLGDSKLFDYGYPSQLKLSGLQNVMRSSIFA